MNILTPALKRCSPFLINTQKTLMRLNVENEKQKMAK